MVDKLNQVSLIKKWYNPLIFILVMVSLISLIAYITLATTPKGLLFKAYFLMVAGPICFVFAVGIIFSTRTYPSQIIFDFENEHIVLGAAPTMNFDEVKIGLVYSKFGFLGVELVLFNSQEYSYRNFFKCDIDEAEFASLLKDTPSIQYTYENKI